ncbi:MAG: ABC transporter ATP-binding protein [Xanthobacteraceae bacterium]
MTQVLALEAVSIRFGGVQALQRVTLRLGQGEFVGLIGPNGAGKTTLIRIVAGILRADSGRVLLGAADVSRDPTSTRVRKGLALTHQIVRPFRRMTVLDNVVLAAGYQHTSDPLHALLHVDRRSEADRAAAILSKVGLAGSESKLAAALPLGQLKRLELARALALNPSVLLLDEPLAGLNQAEASQQADTIAAVNADGITVVLVEHNLEQVVRVCRRLVVLNAGEVVGDGNPPQVMADPIVREAYVGDGMAAHADA